MTKKDGPNDQRMIKNMCSPKAKANDSLKREGKKKVSIDHIQDGAC